MVVGGCNNIKNEKRQRVSKKKKKKLARSRSVSLSARKKDGS